MFIIICAKCDKRSEPQKESYAKDGWQSIRLQGSFSHGSLEHHLCPECCEKLKIPSITDRQRNTTVGEQLVEILTEIAQEANEQ